MSLRRAYVKMFSLMRVAHTTLKVPTRMPMMAETASELKSEVVGAVADAAGRATTTVRRCRRPAGLIGAALRTYSTGKLCSRFAVISTDMFFRWEVLPVGADDIAVRDCDRTFAAYKKA
jgi:hypothetical protein